MFRPEINDIQSIRKSDLIVQMNDWRSYDAEIDDDETTSEEEGNYLSDKPVYKERRFTIFGYGITELGHSISIKIKDYEPFLYMRCPDGWTAKEVKSFKFVINNMVPFYNKKNLVKVSIIKRVPYYGFTNNTKKKYIKLTFNTISAFYNYKRVITESDEKLIKIKGKEFDFSKYLCETKITPLLRFYHEQDIKPIGWIKVKQKYIEWSYDKKSRCQLECSVRASKIKPHELNQIGKFVVASYDIECTSGDGSFPDPHKKTDKVIQIGTTINIFGEKKNHKYIATLKKCNPIEDCIVEEFKDERRLILGWCDFMKKVDPDIITGYNIWGFDWKYIFERAKNGNGETCGAYDAMFLKKLCRMGNNDNERVKAKFLEKELKSSAMGQNFLYYVDIEGIVQIDLMKYVQNNYKLSSYKLNNVSKEFMGQQKEDLSPKQLFSNYKRGTKDDIKEIAVYCVQDCALCNNLLNKLQVLPNNVGMGNVCLIPLSYLFLRGQGIKITSLMGYYCSKNGFMIKDLHEEDIDRNSYEGAIVFPPKAGIYYDPIAVMDYASLYPSSMIAENISHDSIVGYKKYIYKPKVKKSLYDNIKHPEEYPELFDLVENTINNKYDNLPDHTYNEIWYDIFTGKGDDKVLIGVKMCKYAERTDGTKSTLPNILNGLLKARRDTRKKMKYKTCTMNDGAILIGLYSKTDNPGEIKIENVEGDKYLVQESDIVECKDTYNYFQKDVLNGLQLAFKITCNSVYGQVGAATSTVCYKELAASTTAVGRRMVILARDYTLEKYPGSKLTYGDSVLGDEPILLKDKNGKIAIKTIETLSSEWREYKMFKPFDKDRTEKEQSNCDYEVWSSNGWTKIKKVIRHKTNKKIYRINTHCGVVDVTEDHSLLDEKEKIIKPNECIVNETKILSGYPESKNDSISSKRIIGKYNSKLEAAINYYMAKQNGENVIVKHNKNEYIIETLDKNINNKNLLRGCYEIKNINNEQYVYDLETENGNFQAGIGEIIVKNTDSVFINFAEYIKKKYRDEYPDGIPEKKMLELTIEVGQEAGAYVTSKLKKPQDLEYEKTFWPFMIFSKKRYVGHLYEINPNKYKKKSMGIALVRRDYSPVVKDVYNDITDFILKERNNNAAIKFYQDYVKNLLAGKIEMSKLLLSKTLKADYADPTSVPHCALANRMGERDPGNKPQSNERVKFVFIEPGNLKCSHPDCGAKNVKMKSGKCIKCSQLFCPYHLKRHSEVCDNLCRFCKRPEEYTYMIKGNIKKKGKCTWCSTCHGYYCEDCFIKHKRKKNSKTSKITYDKCKKPLSTKLIQSDIVEDPQYVRDNKLKIDYMYYLEHQIENPVGQIFSLFVKRPGKILEDVKRNFNNKKLGNRTINNFFKKVQK